MSIMSMQLKVQPVTETVEDPKPSKSPRVGKKLQKLKNLSARNKDGSRASSRISNSTTLPISRTPSAIRSSIFSNISSVSNLEGPAKGKAPDLQKKIDKLRHTNSTMVAKTRKLDAQLLTEKSQRNYLQLERDKVHQFWELTKGQLLQERARNLDIQKLMERNKTSHVEEVLDLSQHIRMLLLNARTLKEASNQTDVIFETSQRESIGSQTVDDMSKEKLREALQAPDRNFAKLITEAENERMKAESDLKFAVVELEQRLKGEHDREMRRFKEQKQAQFDEIVRLHKEEMNQLQQNFDHDISQERDKIVQLQREVLDLRDDVFTKEQALQDLQFRHTEAAQKAQILEAENEKMMHQLAHLQVEAQKTEKHEKHITNLRKKLQIAEDSNEIILGEFRKLERERNELYHQLSSSVQMVQDRTVRHNYSLRNQLDQAQEMVQKMRDEQLTA